MSTAAWRREHREQMADLRATKKANRTCLQCKLPAKINDKTGEPMAMCEDHLAEDRARVARRASKARKAKRRE